MPVFFFNGAEGVGTVVHYRASDNILLFLGKFMSHNGKNDGTVIRTASTIPLIYLMKLPFRLSYPGTLYGEIISSILLTLHRIVAMP